MALISTPMNMDELPAYRRQLAGWNKIATFNVEMAIASREVGEAMAKVLLEMPWFKSEWKMKKIKGQLHFVAHVEPTQETLNAWPCK